MVNRPSLDRCHYHHYSCYGRNHHVLITCGMLVAVVWLIAPSITEVCTSRSWSNYRLAFNIRPRTILLHILISFWIGGLQYRYIYQHQYYIKLGIMQPFVETTKRTNPCFSTHLCSFIIIIRKMIGIRCLYAYAQDHHYRHHHRHCHHTHRQPIAEGINMTKNTWSSLMLCYCFVSISNHHLKLFLKVVHQGWDLLQVHRLHGSRHTFHHSLQNSLSLFRTFRNAFTSIDLETFLVVTADCTLLAVASTLKWNWLHCIELKCRDDMIFMGHCCQHALLETFSKLLAYFCIS